jgi:mannosyltransferase OCH1-like enzyme
MNGKTNKKNLKLDILDQRFEISDIADNDQSRSLYVLSLIKDAHKSSEETSVRKPAIPRILVQFWNNTESIPNDVNKCLESWSTLESHGFKRYLFNDISAKNFIVNNYSHRHVEAFKKCRHPAMRADYFRLCFLLKNGGFYVDADDVYTGTIIESWFDNAGIKLQPLCYDSLTNSMVEARDFLNDPQDLPGRIYYVNNDPIISPPSHPLIKIALDRSTQALLSQDKHKKIDIQSVTGPGNLTSSLVQYSIEINRTGKRSDFVFITNWDTVSTSKWPLEYRNDERNWRRWNGKLSL